MAARATTTTPETPPRGGGTDGRQACPVARPGFKPGWGRQPLPGRFDSYCLPPIPPETAGTALTFPLQCLHRRVFRIEAIQAHLFLQRRAGCLTEGKALALRGPVVRAQADQPAGTVAVPVDQGGALVQGLVD